MSQSPVDAAPQPDAKYLAGWEALSSLVSKGFSFNGFERNCAYLNVGERGHPRFADVSAVTQLDYLDDGRGIALVDWNHDGALELWITNRTAPRVRFVLNNATPRENHFVAVKLQGRTCNRDAIGARVELHTQDPPRVKVKTLHAGESFLSQSSKWLHFGLGKTTSIDRLVVHWPGEESETFTGLEVDRWFHVTQGSGRAQRWRPPERRVRLEPGPLQLSPRPQATRIVVTRSTNLGQQAYQLPDGTKRRLVGQRVGHANHRQRAVLVTFWASWCEPCLAELAELSAAGAKVRSQGLQVVALNVDGISSQAETGVAAMEHLRRIAFPFTAGSATQELLRQSDLTIRSTTYNQHPFSLPTSLLLDASGQLLVIYRGRHDIAQVLEDAALADKNSEERLAAALPFQGIWVAGYFRPTALAFARAYLEGGYVEEAREHLMNQVIVPARRADTGEPRKLDRTMGEAHVLLGTAWQRSDNAGKAVAHFRHALQLSPNSLDAANNLAWLLATTRRADLREPAAALDLAQKVCRATG